MAQIEEKVLKLSLKAAPFEVMITGEKQHEYRKPSEWIASRLRGKSYDYVLFTHGYGAHRPFFKAKYNGFRRALIDQQREFSNGLLVDIEEGDFIIALGDIVEMRSYTLKP